MLILGSDRGPDAAMGAMDANPPNPAELIVASALASPPIDSLAAFILGGGITSPLAIAAAFRASTSALEGRPRFFG